MTIVSTIITNDLTIHAADSVLATPVVNQSGLITGYTITTRKARKIVRVPAFAGAMSFWGLASVGFWSTHHWLVRQNGEAKNRTAAEFAAILATKLQTEIEKHVPIRQRPLAGIGIHFTVYEDGVPELFLITNFLDTDYTRIDQTKIHVSRETYLKTPDNDGSLASEHNATQYRTRVREFFDESPWNWLVFNNGDPGMFNPVASALIEQIRLSGMRSNLDTGERLKLLKTVATVPIEVVSKVQHSIFRSNRQIVGAPVRWLAIRPVSLYESKTGD
jgi:hypothetical protein